jgi:hypothetical protein
VRGRCTYTLSHRPGEAVDRRLLPEQPFKVAPRQVSGIQIPEPFLQRQRTCERLLHGHLLIEHKAD